MFCCDNDPDDVASDCHRNKWQQSSRTDHARVDQQHDGIDNHAPPPSSTATITGEISNINNTDASSVIERAHEVQDSEPRTTAVGSQVQPHSSAARQHPKESHVVQKTDHNKQSENEYGRRTATRSNSKGGLETKGQSADAEGDGLGLVPSIITDTSNQHSSVRAPRPTLLPGPGGVDVRVPQSHNPFVLPGAEASGFVPMISSPILLRIDGGNPDSSLSGGIDHMGRLLPLDHTKYALFHIPSAVYPACARSSAAADNPLVADNSRNSQVGAQDSEQPQHVFVPMSMPNFAERLREEHREPSLLGTLDEIPDDDDDDDDN